MSYIRSLLVTFMENSTDRKKRSNCKYLPISVNYIWSQENLNSCLRMSGCCHDLLSKSEKSKLRLKWSLPNKISNTAAKIMKSNNVGNLKQKLLKENKFKVETLIKIPWTKHSWTFWWKIKKAIKWGSAGALNRS